MVVGPCKISLVPANSRVLKISGNIPLIGRRERNEEQCTSGEEAERRREEAAVREEEGVEAGVLAPVARLLPPRPQRSHHRRRLQRQRQICSD